mmetsp:Transcript_10006/g.17551  ORF Transcript_10006/g.17551 Transcript_10006/m.17551 type:complete len:417 (+) Transcript_10006:170-1420(+)
MPPSDSGKWPVDLLHLEREIDLAGSGVSTGYATALSAVSDILESVKSCKRALEQDANVDVEVKRTRCKVLAESVEALQVGDRIKAANRGTQASLSRLGTVIKSTQPKEISAVFQKSRMSTKRKERDAQKCLAKAIGMELAQIGDIDSAKAILLKEGEELEPRVEKVLRSIQFVLAALGADQPPEKISLESAKRWVSKNSAQLDAIKSNLHFEVHKLSFLQLVHQGHAKEAVEYAREQFSESSSERVEDIQKLMGCLVFANPGAVRSQLQLVQNLFFKDACKLVNLSVRSPIRTSVAAGNIAVTKLKTYFSILGDMELRYPSSRKSGFDADAYKVWTEAPTLPVDVDLPRDMSFHTVFVCPVTRETPCKKSYPELLPCGHVLASYSREQITKPGGGVRCPTCLVDHRYACCAKPVYF